MTTAPDYVSWFVNREKQYKRFNQMLAQETDMTVMVVEAPTGMGKTFMLKHFGHVAREAGRPIVHIDFRERHAHDTLWLVRHVRDQLGRTVELALFNNLTRTLNQVTATLSPGLALRPTVHRLIMSVNDASIAVEVDMTQLRKNLDSYNEDEARILAFDLGLKYEDLIGNGLSARMSDLVAKCEANKILDRLVLLGSTGRPHLTWWTEVEFGPSAEPDLGSGESEQSSSVIADQGGLLHAPSEQARTLALSQINRAFESCFAQVMDRYRPVFIIDSYEDATDEAEAWIESELLQPIYDALFEHIVVILAGRSTIDVANRKPLAGKTGLKTFEIDHVREYLIERRKIQEDDIEKVFKYSRGLPSVLATMADVASMSEDDDDDW